MNKNLLHYTNSFCFSFDENTQIKLNDITNNIDHLEKTIEELKQTLLNEKRKKAEIIIEQLNKREKSIQGEILCCDNMMFLYSENKWHYYEEAL